MTETSRRGLSPLFTWRTALTDSGLAPTQRLVGLALSLYMTEKGSSAFPGAERLAHDTGLHVATVRAHLGALVDAGYLEVVRAGGTRGERRCANEYRAVYPSSETTPRPGRPVVQDVLTPRLSRVDPSSETTPRRQEHAMKATTPSVEVANVEVDPVIAVFECWQRETGHHRASLDKKRRRVISWALAEYGLDDCLDACRGVLMFPHNRGETNGTRYDSLELIFRDAEHVERFRDRARAGPIAPKGLGGLQAVLQREQVLDVD